LYAQYVLVLVRLCISTYGTWRGHREDRSARAYSISDKKDIYRQGRVQTSCTAVQLQLYLACLSGFEPEATVATRRSLVARRVDILRPVKCKKGCTQEVRS
jgi:hypothetical protein